MIYKKNISCLALLTNLMNFGHALASLLHIWESIGVTGQLFMEGTPDLPGQSYMWPRLYPMNDA